MMRRSLVALAVLAGAAVVPASPGSATPVDTGCPTGYTATPVSYFSELDPDYQLPAILDAEGNGDGIVCALALPDGFRHGFLERARDVEPSVPVIFRFGENDSPAGD